MPDDLETAVHGLPASLATVQWADSRTLRARARRRTARTVLAAPVAVAVVAVSMWALIGVPTAGKPFAAPATATPLISPTGASAPWAASPSMDPIQIPIDAVLQAADVAPDAVADNDDVWTAGTYPAYPVNSDTCPASTKLKITSFGDYLFLRHRNVTTGPTLVWTQTFRYAQPTAARVMTDVRAVVKECPKWSIPNSEASTPERPAHSDFTYTLLGEGFAGDASMLVRMRYDTFADKTGEPTGNSLTTIIAVIRVGDLVAFIQIDEDNPAMVRSLAAKAAARLCAGTTSC